MCVCVGGGGGAAVSICIGVCYVSGCVCVYVEIDTVFSHFIAVALYSFIAIYFTALLLFPLHLFCCFT